MGAKQSKRSVDISGKEAEGAGEVAVAGAGGEGRVEQLADMDALKPQLNGDAHIHEQPVIEILNCCSLTKIRSSHAYQCVYCITQVLIIVRINDNKDCYFVKVALNLNTCSRHITVLTISI